uniref:BCL-6 corepressor PCGF1 binding domain-containing protein n=1 Tax=Pygocentrus nattereri TaxID=42514 RepID=A0AAR2J633_PYGNA
MSVGDGGTVSRESSAPAQASESMVGNPQQTLPPELRGDVPHTQQNKLRTSTGCKTPGVCSEASKASKASNSNHCPEVPPSQPCNNAPVFSTDPLSTPLPDRTEVPKAKADGAGIYPTHHWPCGIKVGAEDSVNSVHGGINPNKKTPHSPGHTQPVISLPPGFQCSTLFKTGQPVAFLPSPNFSSPLCKITLPPGLGQIAALREATASQFQKDCPAPSSGASMTPRLKTYPYHFSVGRGLAPEKKPLSPASKGRSDSVSNAKGCKNVGEHKSVVSSSASPAIALPVQQPSQSSAPPTRYTISPTAAICCSSALANISTQSRLLSLVEKCPQYRGVEKSMAFLKPKPSSSTEEHNASCSPEARDVPLDLSSKSKRQKSIKDAQNSPTSATEHRSIEPHQKNIHASKRPQTATFGTATNYTLLPDTQRNGAPQRSSSKLSNHHSVEPSASWGKVSSQGSLNNLPGTYVGVASPILASTLRSKDGKSAAFVEDLQTFAKQETISIIDQGEQLASRGKKAPPGTVKAQQNKGIKHSASTSLLGPQELLSTPLHITANSQSPRKSLGGKAGYAPSVINSSWPQPSVLSQETSVLKPPSQTQGLSKVKGSINCETPLFHSSEISPTKVEDEKWEKTKSPLSNLESIVKQKALETTALTGENYCNLSAVGSRKSEVASLLNRCQNPPLLQSVATSFMPSRTSEQQDSRPDRTSPPKDVTLPVNTQEATTVTVSKEKKHDKQTKQFENLTGDAGQRSKLSTPKKKCASSIVKTGRKENKLARDLEEDITKKEFIAQVEPSANSKLDGMALSVLQTPAITETEAEKKTNGAKEDSPSKGKIPVTKQKKARKHTKDKTAPVTPKKTATLIKKQQEKESATIMQGPTSKKLKTKRGLLGKRSSSLSADEDSPVIKKSTPFAGPKGSSSPVPKKKGPGRGGTLDSTPSRPVPPEVRRLIVNKNAGETLLQRAARLGYQEVVLYCLEKDVREVNRRDNAGYTALHEACARGWTHIVQVLLKHGADVNCSAQDGTRPIHDAVAADNLAAVWMLLNHGADPTLATYSGQTAVKLAQSPSMKAFLKEYFTDLEGRTDQDPNLQWDFYSSSVFETDQEACWDFLLSQPEEEDGEECRELGKDRDSDVDCLLFEFSSEPLLPCYHVQVSLTQGFCNWFLLTDVLKRLKVSARIFRARYPQFEVASIARTELWRQMTVSQTCVAPDELRPAEEEEEDEEAVDLVRCVPELQGLLGSSIHKEPSTGAVASFLGN